ncbi:MAG: TfoX/Sxy family protein [Pseudoclavibacter sp.]
MSTSAGSASVHEARETLADRVREVLTSDRMLEARRTFEVREKRMFGSVAFMIDNGMAVAAGRDGDLLVHLDPERYDELVARPGAGESFMGNTSMGPSWLSVDAGAIVDDDVLEFWVERGLEGRDVAAARKR